MAADCASSTSEIQESLCNSWQDRSFLIEMKPRQEFASLFVDCPPNVLSDNKEELIRKKVETAIRVPPTELIKVGDQFLELIEDGPANDGVSDGLAAIKEGDIPKPIRKFSAKLADILLDPNSVCAMSWADQNRLFMCKVRAEADGIPFSPKAFRRFEDEISSSFPLRDYIEQLEASKFNVVCRQCENSLHSHSDSDFEFHILPDDDWLDTSPSMEYFCGQTCGGGHASSSHQHKSEEHEGLLGFSNLAESALKWLPNETRVVFTNSFVMFFASDVLKNSVKANASSNSSLLSCVRCSSQVGTLLRNHKNVYKLHCSAIRIYGADPRDCYITNRFGSFERYFAWMLLYKSESQSSMKLLIRTYEKMPYLLVWILEPYVIMTKGVLEEEIGKANSPTESNASTTTSSSVSSSSPPASDMCYSAAASSFPALKILYKIYDADSATTDPRANGMDSSVGIVDVPQSCCLHLLETLLISSHALPPSFRAVGQLFVGFLRLKDSVD